MLTGRVKVHFVMCHTKTKSAMTSEYIEVTLNLSYITAQGKDVSRSVQKEHNMESH
jgi:hypothetical protein